MQLTGRIEGKFLMPSTCDITKRSVTALTVGTEVTIARCALRGAGAWRRRLRRRWRKRRVSTAAAREEVARKRGEDQPSTGEGRDYFV